MSEKMRSRVQQEAKRLGWRPDPHLSQLMGYLRESRRRNPICNLVWLNTSREPRRWQDRPWFRGFWQGALRRAESLGYHLDEIWTRGEGITAGSIARQLKARGVAGVLLPLPEEQSQLRQLNPKNCAWVVIDETELELPFPRVQADRHYNLRLALDQTRALGYQRPAFYFAPYVDRISQHTYSSAYLGWCWEKGLPPRIAASVTGNEGKLLQRFYHKTKPDLIIGTDNRLLDWCLQAGLKVPRDIGVVHLNLAADVSGWAGISQQHEQVGALAVDHLVSLITTRQFGAIPPRSLQVRGQWRRGKTVRRQV